MHQSGWFERMARWLACALMVFSVVSVLAPDASAQRVPPTAPWGNGTSNPQDLKIILVTLGPGDDVASWFGHTAIAVEDTRLGVRRAYNYGMFSFDSTVVPKYIMGRLEFWVGVVPYEPMLRFYKKLDRDVRLLELNLPPEKRAAIAQALEDNIRPENREYLYHHYDDNCATRIRDIIDLGTDGQFKEYSKKPAAHNLRGHTLRHAAITLLGYGMMYAETSSIDGEITAWEEMFLPSELERHALALEYKTPDGEVVPLAGKQTIYYEARDRAPTPDEPPFLYHWMLFWGLLAGGLGLLFIRQYHNTSARKWRVLAGLHSAFIGFSFGGMGCIILLAWVFTDHTVMAHNENLFFTNPVTFLLLPVGLMFAFGSKRAKTWLPKLWILLCGIGVLGVLVKPLPWFDQHNYLTMLMCMVMLGMMAFASKKFLLEEAPEEASEKQ
ncbi:MAG: DUF4105 domain-containing protein [Myxococcota bacterium]|nr:DUF4105 domain-containing protein [Myxococcota bacterium]